MSTREAAVKLASMGLRVFRLKAGTKDVFVDKEWTRTATNDPFEVKQLWTENGQPADYNIGVLADGVIMIDCDRHGGPDGVKAYAEVDPHQTTFKVATPSDGLHVYYWTKEHFGGKDLMPGVNVRAGNQYVVGPGSTFNGKRYEIVGNDSIAPLPETVANSLTTRLHAKATSAVMCAERDTEAQLRKARSQIETNTEEASQGGRTHESYVVAAKLLDIGLSETKAREFLDIWNETKCFPPLSASELDKQVFSAAKFRTRPIGCEDPSLGFKKHPRTPVKPSRLISFPSGITIEKMVEREESALVSGVVYPGDDCWLYAESGAGKSFVALDMAFHIAHGLKWCGRKVKQAPVLYCGLEGLAGAEKRILAAKQRYGETGFQFAYLTPPKEVGLPYLGSAREGGDSGAGIIMDAYEELMRRAETDAKGLIIIDTLARAVSGDDENTAEVATAYIRRSQAIAEATGAAVMTVHHANKNGGFRGSTAFKAAADCMMRIERDRDSDERKLIFEKVKDGDDGEVREFQLKQVTIGHPPRLMDPITSCVIEMGIRKEDPVRAMKEKVLVENALMAVLKTGPLTVKNAVKRIIAAGNITLSDKPTPLEAVIRKNVAPTLAGQNVVIDLDGELLTISSVR